MPADRPDTVVLCGTFARFGGVQEQLAATGYTIVADAAGSATELNATAGGLRFVICDAESFAPAQLAAIVHNAAGGSSLVVVLGVANTVEEVITCFHSGATDYFVPTGVDDVDRLVGRLEELRAGGGKVAAVALTAAVRRLIAKLQHDVKNPIGNILGYIDILREETDTPPNEEQADLLQRIESNCERALALLAEFAQAASRLR